MIIRYKKKNKILLIESPIIIIIIQVKHPLQECMILISRIKIS